MNKSNVSITINRNYKTNTKDKEIAYTISKMEKPNSEKIFVLFTEVSARRLLKWARENNIPEETLFNYYKKYIKPLGLKNTELERVFDEI